MTETGGPKKNRTYVSIAVVSGLSAAVAGIAVWSYWPAPLAGSTARDAAQIAEGRMVYQQNCASCHGVNLEGQPNWKTPNEEGNLPAPPHDASGHTWHHPDGVLLRIVNEGSAKYIGGGYESDMPGFKGVLSDGQIAAVLKFIKSTWPKRERDYQARLSRMEREAGN